MFREPGSHLRLIVVAGRSGAGAARARCGLRGKAGLGSTEFGENHIERRLFTELSVVGFRVN